MIKQPKIAIAQINSKVGAIEENIKLIEKYYELALNHDADILITPELAITGYPLEALASNEDFLKATNLAVKNLAEKTKGKKTAIVIVVPTDKALILRDGLELDFSERKDILIKNFRYSRNSFDKRLNEFADKARENKAPFIHINLVGGQDEHVFDGGSCVFNEKGEQIVQLARFKEDFKIIDFSKKDISYVPRDLEELWLASVLSLKDYVKKSGFSDVLIGLSGGIDSAVVAALAGDALGGEHVFCFKLPSKFTSDLSNELADELCKIWKMPIGTIPIDDLVSTSERNMKPFFKNKKIDTTEENLQARIRGAIILMSLSNKHNWLLLNTGNKSESATGYSTLYGDTCGGFSIMKDMYKTTVFELARWRNANKPDGVFGPSGIVIPEGIIERPPSAELRENHKDEDSLPPYKILDEVLERLIEKNLSIEDIISRGYQREVVVKIYSLLRKFEFKRRQEPPGFEFSERPFGSGYKLPMAGNVDKFF